MERLLDFYKGMDLSFVPQCLDAGMVLRDRDGTPLDALSLARAHGVNAVRLRLWNNPETVPESGGYCSLAHTLAFGREIRKAGLSFLLDFHYSDYWADPAQQRKPKAWESLHGAALEEAMYAFTRDTLLTLREGGAMPDMVQIGNEIRSGLLFPDGEAPDFASIARLVNAGIRAARELGVAVMIHLDQGGRYSLVHDWFSQAIAHGLADFDAIGLSYYPFWHGTFSDLKQSMDRLAADYGKPILLAETAYAWRLTPHGFIDRAQERIAGFPATPQGQRRVMDLVMNVCSSVPGRLGRGVFYWEPFCVPSAGVGGWAENMGILREDGTALEAIEAFAFTRDRFRGAEIAKIYAPPEQEIPVNGRISLPEELRALAFDGTLHTIPVRWEVSPQELETACATPGTHRFAGTVPGVAGQEVEAVAHTGARTARGRNLLQDPNWDEGFARWDLETSGSFVQAEIHPSFPDPFPAPPVNDVALRADRNFRLTLSQRVPVQPGRYRLEAEYRGVDTTNVDVRLVLQSGTATAETVIHPTEQEWQKSAAELEVNTAGELWAGLRVVSPPGTGSVRRFALHALKEEEA